MIIATLYVSSADAPVPVLDTLVADERVLRYSSRWREGADELFEFIVQVPTRDMLGRIRQFLHGELDGQVTYWDLFEWAENARY